MFESSDKIYVAGHRGMVGSAMIRKMLAEGVDSDAIITRSHKELDLTEQGAVAAFFESQKPDYVILAAAKVGGIHANNTYPAEFIYQNLMVQANVIHQSHLHGVKRLLFLGSSCIYPRDAAQPMREDALLTGTLEPTNEPYAVAKIAGIKLCESYNRQYGADFRSVMPTNLYGPNDNFDLENSHVLPALIRKFHEARAAGHETVEVWGTGKPMREFLHVDDMADASLHVLGLDVQSYRTHTQEMLSHINVGTGIDVTIRELAETVARVTGFQGKIEFNTAKPDGTPRKLLDVTRLANLGWKARISLEEGLKQTYDWFLANEEGIRR